MPITIILGTIAAEKFRYLETLGDNTNELQRTRNKLGARCWNGIPGCGPSRDALGAETGHARLRPTAVYAPGSIHRGQAPIRYRIRPHSLLSKPVSINLRRDYSSFSFPATGQQFSFLAWKPLLLSLPADALLACA